MSRGEDARGHDGGEGVVREVKSPAQLHFAQVLIDALSASEFQHVRGDVDTNQIPIAERREDLAHQATTRPGVEHRLAFWLHVSAKEPGRNRGGGVPIAQYPSLVVLRPASIDLHDFLATLGIGSCIRIVRALRTLGPICTAQTIPPLYPYTCSSVFSYAQAFSTLYITATSPAITHRTSSKHRGRGVMRL